MPTYIMRFVAEDHEAAKNAAAMFCNAPSITDINLGKLEDCTPVDLAENILELQSRIQNVKDLWADNNAYPESWRDAMAQVMFILEGVPRGATAAYSFTGATGAVVPIKNRQSPRGYTCHGIPKKFNSTGWTGPT